MSRIVVSDTTAIIHLSKIRSLHLLKDLYGEVLIPQAVYDEITVKGKAQPGALEVMNSNWIKVIQIKNPVVASKLKARLDIGEAEAIALALEKNADVLIIDERAGREIAGKLVNNIIGMVGILLKAKEAKIISEVKPYLIDLRTTGFRINDELFHFALTKADELDRQSKR